jgi:hypothetical protein
VPWSGEGELSWFLCRSKCGISVADDNATQAKMTVEIQLKKCIVQTSVMNRNPQSRLENDGPR